MLLNKKNVIYYTQSCTAGFLFLALLLPGSAISKEALWIEGEDTNYRISSNFIETWMAGPWYHNDGLDMTLLSPGVPGVSEGDWHSTFHGDPGQSYDNRTATYIFNIVEGGTYAWWIRLNPFRNKNGGANYTYSIDNSPWQSLDLTYVTNVINLRPPPPGDIRFIAWAFGGYIDVASAVTIGMLPSLPLDRCWQVGNAAGIGAKLALVSRSKRTEAQTIASRVRYIELATAPNFMQTFIQASYIGLY